MYLEVKPRSEGTVFRDAGTDVVLECEVYGYPRDSSPPVWAWSGGDLQSGRFTTSVTNAPLLNESSVSSSKSVVSKLTIRNATSDQSGRYACSVKGNLTDVSISIGKCIIFMCCMVLFSCYPQSGRLCEHCLLL